VTLGRAQRLDLKARRTVLAHERPVILDRHGIGGERLELHLAANAVRSADLRDTDALGHGRLPRSGHQSASRLAESGCALDFLILRMSLSENRFPLFRDMR